MAKSEQVILDLGERLTIADVHDRHGTWSAIVADEVDVVVNAGSLTNIDTAGIQLMAVLKKSVEARGQTFTWESLSPEVVQVATLIKMQECTGIADE